MTAWSCLKELFGYVVQELEILTAPNRKRALGSGPTRNFAVVNGQSISCPRISHPHTNGLEFAGRRGYQWLQGVVRMGSSSSIGDDYLMTPSTLR